MSSDSSLVPQAEALANVLWKFAEDGNVQGPRDFDHFITLALQRVQAETREEDAKAWQPIETAPRDGTRVICWGPLLAVAECEWREAWHLDPAGWYRSNQPPRVEPTHWRPRPNAPTGICEACDAGFRRTADGLHYDSNDATWGVCRFVVDQIQRLRARKDCP